MSNTTSFSLEYFVSVFSGLMAGYLIHKANPNTNSVIKFFVVHLIIAYFMLVLLNSLVPWMNNFGTDVKNYVEDKTLNQINNMGYMEIFPPLFAVLIIFLVLLYNGNFNA